MVSRIRAAGGYERLGGTVKYLKKGWKRNEEGRGNKDFKKGGASWVKGWEPCELCRVCFIRTK